MPGTVWPHGPINPSFVAQLPLACAAVRFAQQVHRDQRRESDEAPFILHPLEVAALLHNTGHAEHVVAAAILHDTIEDTYIQAHDVSDRFGAPVAEIVVTLTEDPKVESFPERKAALRRRIEQGGDDAAAVYAADKVTKVRELRARIGRKPDEVHDEHTQQRLEHYIESLAMLERIQHHDPLVTQLRFELEALHSLPPRVREVSTDDVPGPQAESQTNP